jgi:HEAT repeat protein
LRLLIGGGRLTPQRAWELVPPLTRDPDPKVRAEAVAAIAMFDFQHAISALAGLEKDAEPSVAAAAQATTQTLRNYRFMNPDKPY